MSRPRPPKLNRERVKQIKQEISELSSLADRLLYFESLKASRDLPTAYIALEAITAVLGAKIAGWSDEDIKKVFPDNYGDGMLQVPVALVGVIGECWQRYKEGRTGQTLGEAFGLEGGGQGASRVRDRQQTRDKHFRIARDTWVTYLASQLDDVPLSLQAAIEKVSEENGLSFDTVEGALKAHRPYLERQWREKGLIEGG